MRMKQITLCRCERIFFTIFTRVVVVTTIWCDTKVIISVFDKSNNKVKISFYLELDTNFINHITEISLNNKLILMLQIFVVLSV